MDTYRQRVSYSYVHCGLIVLENLDSKGPWQPDDQNPVHNVKFCTRDMMFHVHLNFSPFRNDADFRQFTRALFSANQEYNGVAPFVQRDRNFISFYHPGTIDLEDMVQIIEKISELKSAWLRDELNKLKYQAGLTAGDFSNFDGHSTYARQQERGLFQKAWISAKGGTLYFDEAVRLTVLENIKQAFERKQAKTHIEEPRYPTWRHGSEAAKHTVRFLWCNAQKGTEVTRAQMMEILKDIPDVNRPGNGHNRRALPMSLLSPCN